MEFLMRRLTLFVIMVGLISIGCASKYKLDRKRLDIESPWPYQRGGVSAEGSIENSQFDGKLNTVWERSSSDKPAGPMTIYHGVLVYPGSRKKIRFYELSSGDYRGRVKCKAIPQTGLVAADSIAFFAIAPAKNQLYAKNLLNRKTIWKQPVKDACSGSITVNNSLIISSATGLVSAFETHTGELLWEYRSENRFLASASSDDTRVYQPDDKGTIHVLSANDGNEIFRVTLDGPIAAPLAITDRIYATDVLGNVYGLDPENGAVVWKTTVSGPVWTAVAVQNDRLFVGHSGGGLVALDAGSGEQIWSAEVGEVIKASPLAIGDYVVVGTGDGQIVTIDNRTGTVVDRAQMKGSVDYPPVTDGRCVYVATDKGKITCFGE